MNGDLLVLRLKKFQEKHSDLFDKVVIFENTPTICFKQTYVNSIENELVLIKILSELMNDLGLNTTGIIK
jgi:tetrahydromethanopterin S-methyltransferase subunit F